jgi:hypothetical protein
LIVGPSNGSVLTIADVDEEGANVLILKHVDIRYKFPEMTNFCDAASRYGIILRCTTAVLLMIRTPTCGVWRRSAAASSVFCL